MIIFKGKQQYIANLFFGKIKKQMNTIISKEIYEQPMGL